MEKKEVKEVAPQVLQQTLGITTEQLMLVLNESKKPSQEEQHKQDKKIAAAKRQAEVDVALQEERKQIRLAKIANCSHKRRDGTCRAVFVPNGNYLLCQKCQGIVRPALVKGEPESHILGTMYDTRLFNELFQMTTNTMIGD
jgi:hypothetical protein